MEEQQKQEPYQGKVDTFGSKLWGYLTFRKTDPNDPNAKNVSLKAMHIVNKISILMFLGAIIFLILKWTVL